MAVQREPAVDVLVVGGGAAGLAAAIGLRAAGLEVVVAEARAEPAERYGETLPPDVLLALDRLGLAGEFRAGGHLPCPGNVSVWGAARPGHNDFILNPLGPAWHIDRARFEAMLRDRATAAGAHVLTRTRASGLTPAASGGRFRVVLDAAGERRVIFAKWMLDASGPRSWLARRMGARRRPHDRMVALVRLASIESGPLTAQTMVEAVPDGWWYCARLPGGRLVTALMTEPGRARELLRAGGARWRELLASTRLLAPALDGCALAGERLWGRPVVPAALDRVAGDRWLAIGDAACEMDPIAGRGIHSALSDAADATRTIAAAAGRTDPPEWAYADRVAARYEDQRATRAHLYGLERRWPEAAFWRARAR